MKKRLQTIQGGGAVQLKGYLFIQNNKHFSQYKLMIRIN